jgi:hypothetical protein
MRQALEELYATSIPRTVPSREVDIRLFSEFNEPRLEAQEARGSFDSGLRRSAGSERVGEGSAGRGSAGDGSGGANEARPLRIFQDFEARAQREVEKISRERELRDSSHFLLWAEDRARNQVLTDQEYSPPTYEEYMTFLELYY